MGKSSPSFGVKIPKKYVKPPPSKAPWLQLVKFRSRKTNPWKTNDFTSLRRMYIDLDLWRL